MIATNDSLGLLETTGFTPALVALDVMAKAASVQVRQAEVNDFLGICIKITGSAADVETALQAGYGIAKQMGGRPVTNLIRRVEEESWQAIDSPAEFNPLIQQDVVHFPHTSTSPHSSNDKEEPVAEHHAHALGFIETQGFTAVFEAIDQACKTANVEVVGKEKLGGGYVTVIIQGDVAAVQAAIDTGQQSVAELGNLIAAHVIARPSTAVLDLLPAVATS
ncbi:MAG: BMC domain-containing protein [Pirellulaceae bacterium]|jgi:microcompartment protein CcmL/EutN